MHEELRQKKNSYIIENSAVINKKGNAVFSPEECNCYNSENCFLLVSPPTSFTSMASFALSSSSSVLPINNSPQTYEQRCSIGSEYFKKSCCIPSTSFSISEGSKFNFSSGSGVAKFNSTSKYADSSTDQVINSSLSGICDKPVYIEPIEIHTKRQTDRNTSIMMNSNNNDTCLDVVHSSKQNESNKNIKLQSMNTLNNSINNTHFTTYECENTQTGGSICAIIANDIDNDNSSTVNASSLPSINMNSKQSKILNPNISNSKNYSLVYKRIYDRLGPVMFPIAPLKGIKHPRGELKLWPTNHDRVISQNSSKRKVHRSLWIPPQNFENSLTNDGFSTGTITAYPMALKFVEDGNARDGRSIKREIECHLYIYQRLSQLQQDQGYESLEDAWPCAELIGYYLDKRNPGNSVLVTRKLSGPDFFDIIKSEHSSANLIYSKCQGLYEYNKLQWCTLALTRIAQYSALGIRHNDIKPDNIVLDFYYHNDSSERHLDVKIIDLGTASMHSARDFTGGTSWYESPEQKMLEYYTKKSRDLKSAKMVEIGLSSDSWGAGISIAEVLMGRRVVDSMKSPYGPGPLEYRGKDGWLIEPQEWIEFAKIALGFDNSNYPYKYKICEEAAKYVFNMLVQVNSNRRANIKDVVQRMDYYTQKAYQAIRQKPPP
ncbi:Protein kinase domain protein [Cryptosporidium felis]|nr:Protein kinase domain protein [Cryptosporidium felis]